MPRPPVRATERLSKAEELGRLKAQFEMTKKRHKLSDSNIYESLREHIGKIIDNTKVNDWAEIVAAIGLTPITYQGILASEKAFQAIQQFAGIAAPFYNPIFNALAGFSGLGVIINAVMTQFDKNNKSSPNQTQATLAEWEAWLLAFSISYMVVRFGDKLLSSLASGSLPGLDTILKLVGVGAITIP